MDVTAASLHILLPQAGADPVAVLTRAYARLGWATAKPGATPDRSAVLTNAPEGEFITLHDSLAATRGDTALADLARQVSRALATTAILTRLAQDETFEFILFQNGRQIDAAVSDPDAPGTGLVSIRGRPQAIAWLQALGQRRFTALTGPAAGMADRISRFMVRAGDAARAGQGPATVALAAWCDLAGVPIAAALAPYDAAARRDGTRRLAFSETPAARPRPAPRARVLAPYFAPELFPQQGFFPAPWPVPPAVARTLTWPVTCTGGLSSLRLVLHVDRTGPVRLTRVVVEAYTFHNGRIMSATPLVSWGQAVPEYLGTTEPDLAFDCAPFALRDPGPLATTGYILLVRSELIIGPAGEAYITPSIRPDGPGAAPLMLPPLRLSATPIAWSPIGSRQSQRTAPREDAVLRLNSPSVHTAVAILPDTGDDVREEIRNFLADLLHPVTHTSLHATIDTARHPGPSTHVTRARSVVPAAALLQSPAWARLFDTSRNLQSVRIGFGLPDAPWPLAGLVIQTSLRDESGAQDAPGPHGPSIAAAIWLLADPSALSLLRFELIDLQDGFIQWVRGAAPLQAWLADCAWIPEFDEYDSYTMTPYEMAGAVDWFTTGLAGTLTDRAWLRRHVRFVAPRLWLGWELAEHVDATKLTSFAQVTQLADALEILLRSTSDLPLLERALAAVLPAA